MAEACDGEKIMIHEMKGLFKTVINLFSTHFDIFYAHLKQSDFVSFLNLPPLHLEGLN